MTYRLYLDINCGFDIYDNGKCRGREFKLTADYQKNYREMTSIKELEQLWKYKMSEFCVRDVLLFCLLGH